MTLDFGAPTNPSHPKLRLALSTYGPDSLPHRCADKWAKMACENLENNEVVQKDANSGELNGFVPGILRLHVDVTLLQRLTDTHFVDAVLDVIIVVRNVCLLAEKLQMHKCKLFRPQRST